ncbi:hypothetical protein Micbo1qcDRAFT_216576 [Microdochium bolleyi]|uniref:Uncharacterized protein n=1 Tax=Microdochium bolleyi TaxID=196109 RepID=A0A136JCT2_9PEZI|nr:hypothetical protein Micbo1qcDRAFT_216576 [Microdochium bolleyi]
MLVRGSRTCAALTTRAAGGSISTAITLGESSASDKTRCFSYMRSMFVTYRRQLGGGLANIGAGLGVVAGLPVSRARLRHCSNASLSPRDLHSLMIIAEYWQGHVWLCPKWTSPSLGRAAAFPLHPAIHHRVLGSGTRPKPLALGREPQADYQDGTPAHAGTANASMANHAAQHAEAQRPSSGEHFLSFGRLSPSHGLRTIPFFFLAAGVTRRNQPRFSALLDLRLP